MVRYFAYGSNLLVERMRDRGAAFVAVRPAVLREHRLVFDKRGADGTARANVTPSAGGVVYGVVYDLPDDGLEALAVFEGGYDLAEVRVEVAGEDGAVEQVTAAAFVARLNRRTSAPPARSYVALILQGLAQHGLPDAARVEVEQAAAGAGRAAQTGLALALALRGGPVR